MKDIQFEQTRKALHSKQRDLKRKGKGKTPNASAALSEEDIQVLKSYMIQTLMMTTTCFTKAFTSYSTVSQKQQLNMSHTLTGLSSGELVVQSGSSIVE